jgi:uncharacterized heparinase superfamily protein
MSGVWAPSIETISCQIGPASFRFANGACDLDGAAAWNDAQRPKLWAYNLHYFDDLVAAGGAARREWHLDLIDRWMHENPPTRGIGWEPYPTSCRIANWIKWNLDGASLPAEALHSLALQSRHLRRNLEWRLLGNHLFANLTALLFAGAFFQSQEADQWRAAALRLLQRQIEEQVLADGGHCEQSPMYHCIVLTNLLDLINLSRAYPDCFPPSVCGQWYEAAVGMLLWLARMCHPDGRTSFFGDGGFASYDPRAIWDYARRIGISADPPPPQRVCYLEHSGFVRLETALTLAIVDVGEIGPSHQPGHGHADLLSFELSHRGHRIFVNPGTSTYTEGPERSWQRSTAAHNTVVVDELDQSELWGAFRVARRAHPFNIRTEHLDGFAAVEAAHDGYRRLNARVVHHRRFELRRHFAEITDSLEGDGDHNINVWFHLHPDLAVSGFGQRFAVLGNDIRVELELDPALTGSIVPGTFSPRFGVIQPNSAVVGKWSGKCPISFTTRIELH